MDTKSVFCIATSRLQAGRIADCLQIAHFSHQVLSLLLPILEHDVAVAQDGALTGDERVLLGATASGRGSGALGWIPGFRVVALPGIGPFIAAGPLGLALERPAVTANQGVIADALMSFGLPEAEARRYELKIANGNILVSVHTDDAHQLQQAQELFMGAGALDVCVNGEAFRSRRDSSPRAWLTRFGLPLAEAT